MDASATSPRSCRSRATPPDELRRSELAAGLGFEVADLGDRGAFGLVEAHARLWIHLAFACGWGREFGFAVVRR